MDPELQAQLHLIPPLPFDDLEGTRRAFDELFVEAPPVDLRGVRLDVRTIITPGRPEGMDVRVFTPPGGRVRKAGVLDIHGGGFAIGIAEMDDPLNVAIALEVDAVVVAVEYRLAPEHPYPAPPQDCYEALQWMSDNADELGIDPARIAVHGDSAGGGLAATVCLWARDRGGPSVAMQSLLEPELDDRCDTPSMLAGTDTPVWYRSNAQLSWQYYLDGREPDGYSAPARQSDLHGLPPTYITVNQIDPLRDEGIDYARRLSEAGVFTELHQWPGAFHAFDLIESAAVSKRAGAALHAAMRRVLYGEA